MKNTFNEAAILHKLKHYLPAQAPLKDFVHHNTLHAFQHQKFETAIRQAAEIFGYKTSLNIEEYRSLYQKGRIRTDVLDFVLHQEVGKENVQAYLDKLLHGNYEPQQASKIGALHHLWRTHYHLDLDTIVHTNLFRILNSYLDQGVAIAKFPVIAGGFLASLRVIEKQSWVGFLKTKRAKALLQDDSLQIKDLLDLLVGNEAYYENYLFDQQFAHVGWSGLVAKIEESPQSLLDSRSISLRELIFVELLLEIDNLTHSLGKKWQPLSTVIKNAPTALFAAYSLSELDNLLNLWQKAYEWSYYDDVLAALQAQPMQSSNASKPKFQAFFCIDDREGSLRRHIEALAPDCETFGTPGHFGIDAFYQPDQGKFNTKICPVPVQPKHLIKEVVFKKAQKKEVHFTKHTHSIFFGSIISQTLGFWSALKLMLQVFRPSASPASASSLLHMDKSSSLTIENRSHAHQHEGLQIGYNLEEMTARVEGVLRSTGLVSNFAPIIYIMGHGASSTNNTHYAGYDCGACSGRPGSVNARAFSYMANHQEVRKQLAERGIIIPAETEFLGGLHDTTQDEFVFYDEGFLSDKNLDLHRKNQAIFIQALDKNAQERAHKFYAISMKHSTAQIHEEVRARAVSIFEPRPELNHATNSLCIVGRDALHHGLFLDRRAFLNSYNYAIDPKGEQLLGILNAAAPVCGGINLEYYFSRVDNEKLGAGSKLPHNVMGLIGVSNGFEGDLRPGLPLQMVEVHEPLRLLMIVEHFPEVLLKVIQQNPATYEWFANQWVRLVAIHPETQELFVFREEAFEPYVPLQKNIFKIEDIEQFLKIRHEGINVGQWGKSFRGSALNSPKENLRTPPLGEYTSDSQFLIKNS